MQANFDRGHAIQITLLANPKPKTDVGKLKALKRDAGELKKPQTLKGDVGEKTQAQTLAGNVGKPENLKGDCKPQTLGGDVSKQTPSPKAKRWW